MPKKLHILISSDLGEVHPFSVCKKRLKYGLVAGGVFVLLAVFCGVYFSFKALYLSHKVDSISRALDMEQRKNFVLNAKVNELEVAVDKPLKTALGELNQRSQLIESILDFVGVDVKAEGEANSQGGPYAELPEDSMDNVLFRADSYLDAISPIPLGYPTDGTISSRFGRRIDPFTKKPAWHSGVDIKAPLGSDIKATADGVVERAMFDGKYGRYVLIDHHNGFKTLYGHCRKLLVKAGMKVKRGQTIALIGNSGRSTGPHLHYEVRYKGKVIDPRFYVRVAAKFAEQNQM